MIAVIDYGMGNLLSVCNALEMLGCDVRLSPSPAQLEGADRIILPGVGAFKDCMANLREKGFVQALDEYVRQRRIPIFGICLGMQAMAQRSFEGGEFEGLGWFEADVVRLDPAGRLKVPQVGWNEVDYARDSRLFAGLPSNPEFYFVHSYAMTCRNPGDVVGVCDFGGPVTAAVRKGNIFATQFHPEKSQDFGLRLLENFIGWQPNC